MIPIWLKIIYTLAALTILTVYWRRYGPINFLWFCDIALIVLIPAIWLESALLVSMMALCILLPELVWNVVFFARVLAGIRIGGVIEYMYDHKRPVYLRALSLFHVPLPILLLWLLWVLGYDARALWLTTLLAWVVMPVTYLLTTPERNVNWVHGLGGEGRRQHRLHPLLFLGALMLALPLIFYLPTHRALMAWF